jgi:hypothetical protein
MGMVCNAMGCDVQTCNLDVDEWKWRESEQLTPGRAKHIVTMHRSHLLKAQN